MNLCFILGCSGSGKSVLAGALRCLDGTLSANETILPTCLAHLANYPIEPFVREVLARGISNHLLSYASSGETTSRLNAAFQFLHRDISLAEFRRALSGARKYDLLLLESNFYSLAPQLLAEAFPEAKFLFVIRDGRDCADLLARNYQVFSDERLTVLTNPEMPIGRKVDHRYVPWWVEPGLERDFLNATPYGRATWMWKASVRRCHDFYSTYQTTHPNQATIIRYRDLVTTPTETGNRLASWLGKPLNAPAARRFRSFHPNNIGDFKNRTLNEIAEAERIAGHELDLFQYLDSRPAANP